MCKRFGPTQALRGVDLEVTAGEVHALIGENGAGKSTLMNVLSGVLPPDEGVMKLDGSAYRPRHPLQARRRGVAMIHQELMLAPDLSVGSNVLLGIEPALWGWIRRGRCRALVRSVLHQLGHGELPLDRPVRRLGMAEQQIVEIARALVGKPRVLVMDEPTSSLGTEDVQRLFAVIRQLRDLGVSVIYISHVLEECETICDRFTVLRDGESVAAGVMQPEALPGIVRAMVGRELDDVYPARYRSPGAVALRVEGLAGRRRPSGITFTVHRGEIFGLAGQVGSGRTETVRAIFGLDGTRSGIVELEAGSRLVPSPRRSLGRGLGMLSENRKEEGLLLERSIADNVTLTRLDTVSRFGVVMAYRQRKVVEGLLQQLGVKAASVWQRVRSLSGGNQQKVALARLLHQDADVLLLDEPTRGIDVGSKVECYRLVRELAERGKAIVFVSSYLPELLGVCDTIAVLHRGRILDTRPASAWTEHDLLRATLGLPAAPSAAQ